MTCMTHVTQEHSWAPGTSVCFCGERKFIDSKEESVSTGIIGISNLIIELEENYRDVKDLAGEMIATLIIQNNKKLFDHMPSEWFSIVEIWEKKFREISKENSNTYEFDFYELKPESIFKVIDDRYDKYEGHVLVKSSDSYANDKIIPFNAIDIYSGSKHLIPDNTRVKLIK